MIIDAALTNDISFWTGFYQDDPITWASNKAYLDMNRTMTFRESDSGKTEKVKRKIQKNVIDGEMALHVLSSANA